MTAPKRWYQLSMLQLLVAMAVVASLVVVNIRIRRVVQTEVVTLNTESNVHFLTTEVSAGWPFSYFERSYVDAGLNEAPDAPKIEPMSFQEIQPLPFLYTIGFASVVISLSFACTSIMRRVLR